MTDRDGNDADLIFEGDLLHTAMTDPDRFAAFVTRLRDLGVLEMHGTRIVLAPKAPPTTQPNQAPIEHQPRDSRSPAEKKRDVLFAATRFRPALPEDPAPTSNVPRAVVMRRERDGARNGGQGTQG